MKVDFFHVADEAIISQEGKLSAVGIFDRIWTESVPAVHPRLALLARISCNVHEGSQHQLQVQFVDEDGTTVWQSPDAAIEFHTRGPGYPMSHNVAISLAMLAIPRFGDHAFKVLIDGEPIGTAPLSVRPLTERDA